MTDGVERKRIATRSGDDYIQISTRIPQGLRRRVHLAAIECGMPVMDYVVEALREYLAAQEPADTP